MDDIYEDITCRIDKIEDTVSILEDFVLEKLGKFEERLNTIETQQKENLQSLREEMDSLKSTSQTDLSVTGTSTPQTSDSVEPCGSSAVPPPAAEFQNSFGLTQATWQSISPYIPQYMDHKEKLTKVQLAFVLYWIDNTEGVTGKRVDAQALRDDGIKNGVWSSDFIPESVTDFTIYLTDKIKTVQRRKWRMERKRKLEENLELLQNITPFE